MDFHDIKFENLHQSIVAYTSKDIDNITNKNGTPIGEGGSSRVYKGRLTRPPTDVAVKLLKLGEKNDDKEKADCINQWKSELNMLSKLTHSNILKLMGYCKEGSHLAIVTEFMVNGDLSKHIEKNDLTWKQRIRIIYETALGLEYAHSKGIILRDFQTANVFLNEHFSPKIGDFGAATDGIKDYWKGGGFGTKGYIDPVYFMDRDNKYTRKNVLTSKSDVYAYGIMMIEIVMKKGHKEGPNMRELAKQRLPMFVDQNLQDERDFKKPEGKIIQDLAMDCTEDEPAARPTMVDIVKKLEALRILDKERK